MPNNIQFTEKAYTSKLYSQIRDMEALEEVTTYHNFNYGILPAEYVKHPKLAEFFNILALTEDRDGTSICSVIEAKNYPFYAVMFHPERNLYDWMPLFKVPHDQGSIHAAKYYQMFFNLESRRSPNAFESEDDLKSKLVYNYPPESMPGIFSRIYLVPTPENALNS
jgi:gamma-glutamyl hydrolase